MITMLAIKKELTRIMYTLLNLLFCSNQAIVTALNFDYFSKESIAI